MRIDLDTKISDYFGVKELTGRKYGLEFEFEDSKMARFDSNKTPLTRWKLDVDHSLRNGGIEFISRPTAMDKMEIAIDQMIAAAKSMNCRPTVRCGLHVHVNMTDKTFRDLYVLSTLYTLVEPILFAEYADGRQENHFCVPSYCNSVLIEYLMQDNTRLRRGIQYTSPKPDSRRGLKRPPGWTEEQFEQAVNDLEVPAPKVAPVTFIPLHFYNVAKYAALNYSSLKKFGTLEYRQHPSLLVKSGIMSWISQIDRIHEFAEQFNDPLDIIQLYEADGLFHTCEKIGLKQTKEVDEIDLEDAADAATLLAGYEPANWKDLSWSMGDVA